METKSNQYFSKMRVEKTNTFHDDIRVIVVGFLFCLVFIITPVYFIGKIEPATHIKLIVESKE